MNTLGVGIIGTGWVAGSHIEAFEADSRTAVRAIVSRDKERAHAKTEKHGLTRARAYDHLEQMLDDPSVQIVSIATPHHLHVGQAIAAARAGKHLMLEKPIAIAEAEADDLVAAVAEGQVASVVFFTLRFREEMRAWLADVTACGGWAGGLASWFGSSLLATSPFNTPWRRDKGALWDLAPHVIALLWAALGPVTSVTADAGPADVSHLILHHQGGASSTVTVSQNGGEAAAGFEVYLWSDRGRSAAPRMTPDPVPALSTALTELVANIRSGRTEHPCDVRSGRDVGHVIAEAQRQIDQRLPG